MKYQHLQCYDNISFMYQSKYYPTFSMKYNQSKTLEYVLKTPNLIKAWEVIDICKCQFVILNIELRNQSHLIKQLNNKINVDTSISNLPSMPSKIIKPLIYQNTIHHSKNYNMNAIQLANDIYSICPQVYKLLHDNLNFHPSIL